MPFTLTSNILNIAEALDQTDYNSRISCTNNILLQIENAVKLSGTAIHDRDPYLSYSFIIDVLL